MAVAPVNHLPHTLGIANAEVLLGANGEHRFQNAGQRLGGAWFHAAGPEPARGST